MPEARKVRGLRGKGQGQGRRESLQAGPEHPAWSKPPGQHEDCAHRPPDHPPRQAHHPRRQCPPDQGRRFDREPCRRYRPARASAEPQRPSHPERGRRGNRLLRRTGGRPPFARAAALVKQKKLAKNSPVPCIVRTEGFVEADCRLLGRQPQGSADRLQAGLDPRRQGGAVQAQRPHARNPANRRRRLPRLRHHRQSRRQGIPVLDHREGGA